MNYYGEERIPLKACLHTHTTHSDGSITPEDTIDLYAGRGYGVLALTDHHQVHDMSQYDPQGMILIQGAELHPLNPGLPRWHLVALDLPLDFKVLRPFETGETAQEVIDAVTAAGGIVSVAHPYWCSYSSSVVAPLEKCFAMEIYNTECEGIDRAYSLQTWDELLASGKKLPAVAVDDTHHVSSLFGGWTVICAKERTRAAVMEALRKGEFYASQGPEFHSITLEGNTLRAEFTEAVKACFVTKTGGRRFALDGRTKPVSAMELDLTELRTGSNYVRCVITNAQGRSAWSNPIYI